MDEGKKVKTVKIGKLIYNIPLSWDDITVKKFIRLYKLKTTGDVEFVAAILDCDVDIISNCKDSNLDLKIFPHLEWYADIIKFSDLEVPKVVHILDKVLEVPKDVGFKTFGQKLALQDKLLEAEGNFIPVIHYACGVYFYEDYYKKEFDKDEAMKFSEEIVMNCRIMEMYPVASFFFRSLTASMNSKIDFYTQIISRRKSGRELKILKNLRSSK